MYISHNGADTPLVQSQVVPYLDGLVARGFPVELFTFERSARPAGPPSAHFRWHPLAGRAGAGLLDKAIDLFRGTSDRSHDAALSIDKPPSAWRPTALTVASKSGTS